MTDLITLPQQASYDYREVLSKESRIINQQFYYFCLNNSVSYRHELKTKLKQKLAMKISKKLSKKLKKPIRKLALKRKSLSGIIKLSLDRNQFEMFHYFLRLKKKSKEKIELFLVKISEEFDVVKAMKKLFKKSQKKYRQGLKEQLNPKQITYLKMIGHGKVDYDIERKLNCSRVELIDQKIDMVSRLELRNDKELYWVAQRAGYCVF